MKDLKNKNIIVTGASGGIGNSIINKLNNAGANILVAGSEVFKAEDPVQTIKRFYKLAE